MKKSNFIMTAATLAGFSMGALADVAHAASQSVIWTQKASRAQVAFQCHVNNGSGYNLGGTATEYGCITPGSYIHCDADGNCEAGRNEPVVSRNRQGFQLPQPRLR